jgi:hypothetical protein
VKKLVESTDEPEKIVQEIRKLLGVKVLIQGNEFQQDCVVVKGKMDLESVSGIPVAQAKQPTPKGVTPKGAAPTFETSTENTAQLAGNSAGQAPDSPGKTIDPNQVPNSPGDALLFMDDDDGEDPNKI